MNSNNKSGLNTTGAAASEPKKAYCSPSLQVYGDVRATTSSVGLNGGLDGMAGAGMTNSLP
jgi:hypothetical protein